MSLVTGLKEYNLKTLVGGSDNKEQWKDLYSSLSSSFAQLQ